MGYVTMEGLSFKSLLSSDEMKEAIRNANMGHLDYGEGSHADFTISECWRPDDEQHHVYELIPFNEDYYFEYRSEVIDSIVDFLKTVIAPGTYTHLMFHGEDADMWGYLIRNGCINNISYKLVVKTEAGEVDMEEFTGEVEKQNAQSNNLLKKALFVFNAIPDTRLSYEDKRITTYEIASEIGKYLRGREGGYQNERCN